MATKLKLVTGTTAAVSIADAIDDAVLFAEGIAMAVIGEELQGGEASPVLRLLEHHIEKLGEIKSAFEQLRTDLVAGSAAARGL